jgi:hypothetical protein
VGTGGASCGTAITLRAGPTDAVAACAAPVAPSGNCPAPTAWADAAKGSAVSATNEATTVLATTGNRPHRRLIQVQSNMTVSLPMKMARSLVADRSIIIRDL